MLCRLYSVELWETEKDTLCVPTPGLHFGTGRTKYPPSVPPRLWAKILPPPGEGGINVLSWPESGTDVHRLLPINGPKKGSAP